MQQHSILGLLNGNLSISPGLTSGPPQYTFISIFFRCCEPIKESSIKICQLHIFFFHLTSITKPFLSTQSTKITNSHPTIAYTHPTSHTNTLNHYHFVLKQIQKLKTKLTPITNFKLSSNKNINKNIIIPVLRKLMAYPITLLLMK